MYLGSAGSLSDNSSTPGQQHFITGQELTQSQTHDDELDAIASIHRQSTRSRTQDYSLQDAIGDNDGRYLQVSSTQSWNPVVAANYLQQAHPSVSYLNPTKQPSHMISDEGYYTIGKSQQDTRSVISDHSGSFRHAVNITRATPRSIPEGQRPRTHSQGQAGDGFMAPHPTNRRASRSEPAESVPGPVSCDFEGCAWTGKTHSDFKKHCARHDLHHICDHDDCSRRGKGFATVNDLQRHRRSVHKLLEEGERFYRCLAKGCSKPTKDWPRKDNFRSHLRKTHPNEDVETLVKMSEDWWDNDGKDRSVQQDAPHIRVQEPDSYNGSGLHPIDYYQQGPQSVTPHLSSSVSDSERPHSSPAPQTPFSNAWVGQDIMSYENLMPGTPQYQQRQHAQQQSQVMARQGYMTSSMYATPSSPLQRTYQTQQASNNFQRSQPRLQVQRASVPNNMLGPPHAVHGGQASSQSHARSPSAQRAPVTSTHQMSRTTSVNPSNLQSHVQAVNAGRSRTVADFRSFHEEQMTEVQAVEPADAWNFDFSNQADALTNVGGGVGSIDFLGPALSTSTNPQNVSQTFAADQGQGNDNSELSVEINNFLKRVEDMAENGQIGDAITALRSVEGPSVGGSSTEVSQLDVNADVWIEEIPKDNGKSFFRCKWEKVGHKCGSAKKLWPLRSEIKKHIKRHTKPYGCTFENCYKRFGSKSDWMRHELKRHQQQDCWRCEIPLQSPAPGLQRCRQTFGKKEQFTHHLQHFHQITDPQLVNPLLTKQHINSGFQPQYWCGFCREIQRLQHKGKQGYHERYDHIAKHVSDEEKSIDDWYPPEGKLSKREILAQKTKARSNNNENADVDDGDAEEDEHDVSQEDDTAESSLSSTSPPEETPGRQSSHATGTQQYPLQFGHSNKRSASEAGIQQSQQRVERRANFWRCELCQEINLLATSLACNNCDHQWCKTCKAFWRSTDEDI